MTGRFLMKPAFFCTCFQIFPTYGVRWVTSARIYRMQYSMIFVTSLLAFK